MILTSFTCVDSFHHSNGRSIGRGLCTNSPVIPIMATCLQKEDTCLRILRHAVKDYVSVEHYTKVKFVLQTCSLARPAMAGLCLRAEGRLPSQYVLQGPLPATQKILNWQRRRQTFFPEVFEFKSSSCIMDPVRSGMKTF